LECAAKCNSFCGGRSDVSSDVYRAMGELYQSGYFFELFRLVILSIDCIGEEDSLSQP
jgi:hypothetical protein